MPNYQKADLARKYRKEYDEKYKKEYPGGFPTRKLARIMYRENKLRFTDEEEARQRLRYIEGKTGEDQRKNVRHTDTYKAEKRIDNPYKLPESDAKDIPAFEIKGDHQKALLIADVHLPYQDNKAITVCFDYAKKEKPDLVILDGDIIDAFQLSKFVRDPKLRNFAEELKMLEHFVEVVKKTFKCRIIYKMGNHEKRYEDFLYQKAGELVGVEEFELKNIIEKRAPGVEFVEDKKIIMLNELAVLHGHEFNRGFFNPVNVARGLHLRAKVSAIQAHSHKSSEHNETDLHGIIKTTWSVGCLAHLKPAYDPYNSWNHGFAFVDLDKNGVDYDVRNKRIYKNRVM